MAKAKARPAADEAPVEKGKKRPAPGGDATISAQLRRMIEGWGLSCYEVATRAEIEPSVLGRFLDGSRGLSMATLDRIVGAYPMRLVEGGPEARKPRAKATPKARAGAKGGKPQ